MTGPSSVPRGEHTPRPGPAWAVAWHDEYLAAANEPEPPHLNRAQRRTLARAARTRYRPTTENPMPTTPCPAKCGRHRQPSHYLCRPCWRALPDPARRALNRRDDRARTRLRELYAQLERGVPVTEIQIGATS